MEEQKITKEKLIKNIFIYVILGAVFICWIFASSIFYKATGIQQNSLGKLAILSLIIFPLIGVYIIHKTIQGSKESPTFFGIICMTVIPCFVSMYLFFAYIS